LCDFKVVEGEALPCDPYRRRREHQRNIKDHSGSNREIRTFDDPKICKNPRIFPMRPPELCEVVMTGDDREVDEPDMESELEEEEADEGVGSSALSTMEVSTGRASITTRYSVSAAYFSLS